MYCDTHTHLTPYSHDAQQTVQQLLARAASQGLSAVCTADHYEKDIFYQGGREDIFDVERYFNDLSRLQMPADGPRLLPGVELGYLPHLDRHYAELTARWPFNSVILSLHILEGEDPFINSEMYRHGKADVYGRYLRQLAKMARQCPDFNIIGHFDYISRYAPYADRKMRYADFAEDFDRFFATIIDLGKAFEINTRTIIKLQSCGYQGLEAWPDPQIISRYLEMGGQYISLGSDAHKPDEAGLLFPETTRWLRSLGCKSLVHYEKRQPVLTSLDDQA